MEEKKKCSGFKVLLPVLAALICVITSVSYIVFKTISNRNYAKKWEDYDECGVQ